MIKSQDTGTYKLVSAITGQILKVVSIKSDYEKKKEELEDIRLKVSIATCQPCRFLHWVDATSYTPDND